MTLAIILSQKGRDVATVPPERAVGDVVRMLSERKIGAVVVADGGSKVLGIFSERDVIRVIAGGKTDALGDSVSQHMTRDVVTAQESTSVLEALGRMTEKRFRHLPVVESGKLVGIVSIGDLVKHRLSEMENENQALHDYITAV